MLYGEVGEIRNGLLDMDGIVITEWRVEMIFINKETKLLWVVHDLLDRDYSKDVPGRFLVEV